ncbi:MAG TPA: hypothetical protein PKE29_06445 [Phycisphaerales bacterium]|nr:hypothetical protein [Phycisphaerales bacterium]
MLKVVVGTFRYTNRFGSLFGAPKPLEVSEAPVYSLRRFAMAKKKAKKKTKKKGSKKK